MYAVVLLRKLQRMSQAVIYIVPFNVLFLLFIITYGRAVSQPPGYAEVHTILLFYYHYH